MENFFVTHIKNKSIYLLQKVLKRNNLTLKFLEKKKGYKKLKKEIQIIESKKQIYN